MSRKLSFFIFAIFAFAALFLGFKQMDYQANSSKVVETSLDSYSWQMFDSTSWVIDAKENKQSSLKAQSVHYQEESQIAEFTRPEILQLTPEKTTHIQSMYATSTENTEVLFVGQVKMQSLSQPEPNSNKTLITEQITYNNQTQQLSSPLKVTLQAPNLSISGVGFDGNLTDGHYQFYDKVTTFYQPTKD